MNQPRLSEMIEKILESDEDKEEKQTERKGFGRNLRKEILSEEQQVMEQFSKAITQRRINTL